MNHDFGVCSDHRVSIADNTQLDRPSLLVDALLQEKIIGPGLSRQNQSDKCHPSIVSKEDVACNKKGGGNKEGKYERQTKHSVQKRDDVATAKMIDQMKHELAEIRSEQELRDDFLQGLRDERYEILSEIKQAKAEEQEAIAHAEDMAKEVARIRRQLDRFQEKIPKLRKKVEKKYKRVMRLKYKVDTIDLAKQVYLRDVDKLKGCCKDNRKYYDPFLKEIAEPETCEFSEEIGTYKHSRRHGQNMTNWTSVLDIECSEDRLEEAWNSPRLRRSHWKKLTKWTNVHSQFRSSVILNSEMNCSSQVEETNSSSATWKGLNKCSSMPDMCSNCYQDNTVGVKDVRKFSRLSNKIQSEKIVGTMNLT